MNEESTQRETTFEDIRRVLWAGADTFRGVIDAANYKEYVLSMLFIKYLDDTFAEAVEGLERKYAGNELRVSRAIRNLPFRLEDNVRFRFLFERRFDDKIGALINEALRGIEDLNADSDRLWVEGQTLCIESRHDGEAQVVAVNGMSHSILVGDGVTRYSLEPGYYVVILNGKSHKIAIR